MVLFCACPYTAVHLHLKCIKFGESCLSQQGSRKRDWNAACCVYTVASVADAGQAKCA